MYVLSIYLPVSTVLLQLQLYTCNNSILHYEYKQRFKVPILHYEYKQRIEVPNGTPCRVGLKVPQQATRIP